MTFQSHPTHVGSCPASGDAAPTHAGEGAANPGHQYHARADSPAESVQRLSGTSGVNRMRERLYEARHTAIAAGLQGRGV